MRFIPNTPFYRQASNDLPESCPKNGDVPRSPLVPIGSLIPSAGDLNLEIDVVRIAGAIDAGLCCDHFGEENAMKLLDAANFCIWQRVLPRFRLYRASLGRKPIRHGQCA